MARRTMTFENVKFFTKRMLRKYTTNRGVLLDQNQKKLTVTSINDDDTSFRRRNENNGIISTQQIPVDNSLFQNNTFFGSAEAKINVAFDKIINKYPFDGSLQQVEQFEDSLSSLEKYVLDRFPKNKGFVTFSSDNNQYITVKDKSGNLNKSLLNGEEGVAYINPELNPFSIEMAIRLPEETNQKSFVCHSVSSTLNTGFAVFLDESSSTKVGTLNFAIVSGSSNYASASYAIDKGKWYNLSFFYDNREEQQSVQIISGSNVLSKSDYFFYPGLNTAGADLTIADGPTSFKAGHLDFVKASTFKGSIDEFRIFHGARTSDEMEYYSNRNTFAHENLRFYLRFNEPMGSHSNNDVVLDHSGNSLHSRISNYQESMRNPGNIPDPSFLEDKRFSPILFPNYPDVISLNAELLELATEYDINNPNMITKLIPNHYLQEGAYLEGLTVDGSIVENYSSTGTLPKSGRIGHAQLMSLMLYYMSEELDQYKMFLDQVSQFLHPDYEGKDGTADAFLPDLAKYYGFDLPKIFGEVSFEQFLGKENLGLEYSIYERNLFEIQNLIWRRVLKNISHIFKSKGTKYAIETIFRSAGIEPGRIFRLVEYNGVNEFRMGISRQQITEMSTMLNFSGSLGKFPEVARADGTLNDRPTLLTAPLTASRIEPGFPEISGRNVLASASIYFHPRDRTAIPPADTQLTIQDAFNKTEFFKFLDQNANIKATATVTVANGAAAPGLAETDLITLESVDGTIKRYVVIDATTTTLTTGTILGVGSDLGSRVVVARTNTASLQNGRKYRILSVGGTTNWQALGASSNTPTVGEVFTATSTSASGTDHGEVEEAVVGGIAVAIAITGSAANGNTFLQQLRDAIRHDNGHNGKITVSDPTAGSGTKKLITLTQSVTGNTGNRSTSNLLTGANVTVTNFTGGTKVVSRLNYIATLTVPTASSAHGTTEKQSITLVSTDGTEKKYVIVHGGATGTSAVATGTVLISSSDTGTSTAGASNAGGVAVNILNGDSQRDVLVKLKTAVDHANGHNAGVPDSKIIFPTPQVVSGGELKVELMQAVVSSAANKSISNSISNITPTNFTATAKTSMALTEDLNTSINSVFSSAITTKTGYKSTNSNKDTIDLSTISSSRSNLGNHSIILDSTKKPALWVRMSNTSPTNKGTLVAVVPAYQPRGAFATLQVASPTTAHGTTALESITIISTNQTSKTYTIVRGASAVATGTVLAVGSNVGRTAAATIAANTTSNSLVNGRKYRILTTGSTSNWKALGASSNTPAAGEIFTATNVAAQGTPHGTVEEAAVGTVAVKIIDSATRRDVIAVLKAAIEDANGHGSLIVVPTIPSAGSLTEPITLTQNTIGSAGATTITSNISNVSSANWLTVTNFIGNPMPITTQAVTSAASFSVNSPTAVFNTMTEALKVTIKSDSGVIRDYFVSDTNDGGPATGTDLTPSQTLKSNSGSPIPAVFSAGADGIAVGVNLSSARQSDVLAQLRAAILSLNNAHKNELNPSTIVSNSFNVFQGSFDNPANATITSNIPGLVTSNFTSKTRSIDAVQFDGFNDSVSIGTATQWNDTIGSASSSSKKMSFCMWIYKSGDGEGNEGRIFDFGEDIFLYTTNTEILAFSVKLNNNSVEWRTDQAYLTLNSWNHVAVTYDATNTAANNPTVYINGVSKTVTLASGTKHATFSGIATEGCFIGNRHSEDRSFKGKIGEFQIYKDILTADEVTRIYNAETDESIPPFISVAGFAGGNGFVRANTQGYEYNGISATKDDGLLTSGSWTVEGIYQFTSNLSKEDKRSLSRIVVQGSTTGQNWKDKHAVLSNLVLSPFGDQLTLYVRNRHHNDAPTMVTALTGANCLDGRKWYIAYGRQRNDEASQPVSSSYFIRAAALDYDKIKTYISTGSFFNEGATTSNMFQKSSHLVSTDTYEHFYPPQILIGSQSMVNATTSGKFLNDTSTDNVPTDARTTYFDGRVGHIKFWSKRLSEEESKEHARNFKSVGVDSPLINNTFSTTRSGSFQKLRLNVSTDQVNRTSNPTGRLDLLDFSQTFTPMNESKIKSGVYTSMSGAACFGFEGSRKIVENSRFDFTIISPFYDEYLDSDKIRIAGFSDGHNIKLFNSKLAPVTKILPFEKKVNDNRFEIQVHLQRGLDEDIMNIFSAIDALDDALGRPELAFTREYPDLRHMRELYFNRLTDKVNYRNFFDLFRWLDDAFSDMIEKFVPRNSNFLGINLIIESHALERCKITYGHQEIYKGEDERSKLRSKILVSQRSGVLRRF